MRSLPSYGYTRPQVTALPEQADLYLCIACGVSENHVCVALQRGWMSFNPQMKLLLVTSLFAKSTVNSPAMTEDSPTSITTAQ